jgi:VWFA-related protein
LKKLIFLLAIPAFSQTALAQNPQGPDTQSNIIRSETRLVLVDTVVSDKKGNPIRDLTQKDFKVFEDNKEQTLVSFSHEAAGESAQGIDKKHYTVLLFDDTTAGPVLQSTARGAALKFIESNTGPNKLMAVAELGVSLKLTQSFTEDAARLKQVVIGSQFASGSNAGNTASLNEYGLRNTIGSLRGMIQSLASLPGRKSLILISAGYPSNSTVINEMATTIEAANKANVAVYPVVPSPVIPSGVDASGTSDGAAASGTRGGGRRGGGGTAERTDTSAAGIQGILYNLASGTGGFVVDATTDLGPGFTKIGKDQEEYYILGYTPSKEAAPGVCHTLRVKVDKGGEVVRSRSGYCEAKTQDVLSGTPTERDLVTRMSANATPTVVGADMQTSFVYTAANTARVDMALDLPAGALQFAKDKGKFRSTLNLVGIAYLPDGSVKARFSDSVPFTFEDKKEADAFSARPYHYEKQFRIAPGSYEFRLVFSSSAAQFGKLDSKLTVEPWDSSKFALSSLALSRLAQPAKAVAGFDLEGTEDYTALTADGVKVVPSGSNRFHKTDKCYLYAELYEPAIAQPGVRPEEFPAFGIKVEILDAGTGKTVRDLGVMRLKPPATSGNPAIPMAVQFNLADLAPGAYTLRVTGLDSKDRQAVRTAALELQN